MSPQHVPSIARPGRQRVTRADLEASLVVFLVALPLSLGIAIASGAPVASGIIAAVAGGIVAGVVGGVPLQVTGPAAGLTAVVAGLVAEHGWEVTCLITLLAGLVQIGLGVSRVARAALAISPAVVHGMLAGIGLTIVLGQLHVLMGGRSRSSALESLRELPAQLWNVHTASVLLGLGTVAVTLLWPRLPGPLTRVPAPLAAVTLLTAVSLPFAVDRVELPGNILDAVRLPGLPDTAWASIALGVVTVALVASVESVLSAVAVEKMSDGPRGDLDRELVGQGAANTLSGLLGGLPVTGVIVRSATNVRAGARTKWSAVLHAVWIAVFAVVLVGVVREIPLSVLAGLLVTIGIGLVDLGHLRAANRHGEGYAWVATLLGVVFLNLLEGVIVGIGVALVFAVRRTVLAPVEAVEPAAPGGPWRVVVQGTLTFVSVPKLARQLAVVPPGAGVRLEVDVDFLDHAASDRLTTWVDEHRRTGGTVDVVESGVPVLSQVREGRAPRRRVRSDGPGILPWSRRAQAPEAVVPAADLDGAAGLPVLRGVGEFQNRLAPLVAPVLSDLSGGQSPTTLFIACADSRVVPNLITSSGPGDLFTVQNVGNVVPRPGSAAAAGDSTLAAVEYAVDVLGVGTIAVCGHSGCGAMQALLSGSVPDVPDRALGGWLAKAHGSLEASRGDGEGPTDLDHLGRVNVVEQLGHLRAHPSVAAAQAAGRLELVGLFFDIGTAQARVLDQRSGRFEVVSASR